MTTEQVNICNELQVTLEFNCGVEGLFDRAVFNTRVRECIEPQVRRGITSGKDALPDIVVIKYHPDRSEELERTTIRLIVTWRAHRPWWSDNPDWAKAPAT